VFTADGWYRTGDLGRLDADGYLWYSGRLDDMIKVKGATVYPAEVEAGLRSIEGVRQAHVAAVTTTDGSAEIGAVVVTDASLDAVRTGARARLSAFKVPTRWLVTADPATVPMLASGKVDVAALRSLLDDPTRGTHR
jgi:acyl-CoA synthetase (AMP-forming)/AMP-acid ligase II